MKPAILILTATITPPDNVPNLKRSDPLIRRKDYLEALRHYLTLPNEVVDRIVFIENSQSDLSDLKELAELLGNDKHVEFISFNGLDYPPHYGRAYGEFKMLDFGVQNSVILNSIESTECFWKVTGRLKLFNLKDLIKKSPPSYKMIIDFLKTPTEMVDLRLFTCSKSAYKTTFEGLYEKLREDQLKMSAEGYLYKSWNANYTDLGITPRFKIQPKIGGIGGQHNEDYLGGINSVKFAVRNLSRRLFPKLWI